MAPRRGRGRGRGPSRAGGHGAGAGRGGRRGREQKNPPDPRLRDGPAARNRTDGDSIGRAARRRAAAPASPGAPACGYGTGPKSTRVRPRPGPRPGRRCAAFAPSAAGSRQAARRRAHAALASLRPHTVKMPALKVIAGTVRRLKRESGRAAGQFVQNGPRAQAGAAPATVGESTHRNRHCAQAYGRHGKARYGNPDKDARSGSARKPGDRPGARTDRRWAWLRTIAPARIPPCRFLAGPDPCRPRG